MPLHPEIKTLLDAAIDLPGFEEMTPDEARAIREFDVSDAESVHEVRNDAGGRSWW